MAAVTLEEFLKPISEALGRSDVPASVEPCAATRAPLASDYREYTTAELSAWFVREAEKMGTQVREVAPSGVAQAIVELVDQFGDGGHLVYADVPDIDAYGIPGVLEAAGLEAHRWDPSSYDTSVGRAENADIGITVACAGIAETATIVQRCTQNSGRAICLLPIGHIALLKKSELFPYMTQLMDQWEEDYAQGDELPSNITFISGPSNTADIELVRVVGVHGPVHAGVILIDDEA